jgi:Tol biopolymer transport system component
MARRFKATLICGGALCGLLAASGVSGAPPARTRLVAAAAAAGLAVCLGALVLAPSASATFPGKNGKIAFVHTVRGGLPEVYTMRPDGSHERHLANGLAPAFSPSGRKVLFSRRGTNHLYTIRANATRLRRIPHTSRGFGGSFAPSGKKIVFTRARRNNIDTDLYTIRLDGSHRKRLPHGAGDDPQFSPNGRWIVFHKGGGLCHICLIRPNGTRPRSLTDHMAEPVDDYSPDFSPNGRRIVFTRETDPLDGPRKWAIYTIRKDGTHLKRVYEATNEIIEDPVFSPDGRKIAFSRREFFWKYRRIYTIRPDGSHLRRLSHGPGGHEQLSWGVRP